MNDRPDFERAGSAGAPAPALSRVRTTFWSRARSSGTLWAGLILLVIIVSLAMLAPWIAPHSATEQNLSGGLQPPSPEHWFGTDQLGRDVLSRMLYAGRVDLSIAVLAALTPFVVGVLVGLISGYFRGPVDWVASRVVDTVIAFPFYVMVIAIVFAVGAGPGGIVLAFALVGWVGYARVIRALAASLRDAEWVRAARGGGLSHARVLLRHMLPNVLPQAIVLLMTEILLIMVAIVTLGYLGLGIQPPTPDWGTMIADGQQFVTSHWWLSVAPGLAVVVTGIGLSLLADGLGDAWRVGGASERGGRAGAKPQALPVSAVSAAKTRGLRVRGLEVTAAAGGRTLVSPLGLDVAPGEALGLVGESGSGKSLTLRAILGLPPEGVVVTAGEISTGGPIGMVFQDPLTALDPLARVESQLGAAVRAAHPGWPRAERRMRIRAEVHTLLEAVGLGGEQLARIARSFPFELSGGQRQRVVIAMALAGEPAVLLCDEPTTALDVTIQRHVLELIDRLRRDRGLAIVFVSHDLAVVSGVCERIAVMRNGVVVEQGAARRIATDPEHAYTQQLLAAVPRLPAIHNGGAA